jgi:hypothetical protein
VPPLPEPELLPPEFEVAPLGVAPPFAPDVPPECEPLVPLEPVEPPLDVAPVEPDVPEDADPEEAEPPEAVAPEDDEVVVVEVVEVVAFVEAGDCAATVAVGTVSGGAPAVLVGGELPPHAARAAHRARPASARALSPGRPLLVTTRPRGTTGPQTSSGSMRRPQCGQSLRSFWQSWSHQLQKRRFSTDHGSSEAVGARGRS